MNNFEKLNLRPLMPDIPMPDHLVAAEKICKYVVSQIISFEKTLPNDLQAGGTLANFGGITFAIEKIGFKNPNIIILYGTLPDGSSVRLIQHTSQLNLLLTAVPRKNPEQPRRPIGFGVTE
ncbi:MAG: DUF6173 family protein [Phascolarctobacterium sp.]